MLERLGTTFIVLIVCVPIRNIKAVCVGTRKFTTAKIWHLSHYLMHRQYLRLISYVLARTILTCHKESAFCYSELGSSVGIGTDYGLDSPGSKPSWARFYAVQTSPGAHPDSRTMGTGSFPGLESGRGVTLTLTSFYCRGPKLE